MRLSLAFALAAGCASAGVPSVTGDGGPDGNGSNVPPVDACPDTDNDGACNNVDKCPMHDDRLDTDADTVADGCDRCPGQDDRPDTNANGTPDCAEVMTRTINIKQVGTNYWRGWQANSGGTTHDTTNDNTATGTVAGTLYNSYFVFNLAGLAASAITEVKLDLELETYGGDASEVISVWDVTTPAATVETTPQSTAVYNDLGTGTQYGTATITAASVSTTTPVMFTLNAQAATDLKAKLGADFVIGVKVEVPPGYVRFSSGLAGEQTRIERLVIKFLP